MNTLIALRNTSFAPLIKCIVKHVTNLIHNVSTEKTPEKNVNITT